jgi:hypothetical protein
MFFGQKTTTLDQDLSQNVVVLGPNVVVFCPKKHKVVAFGNFEFKSGGFMLLTPLLSGSGFNQGVYLSKVITHKLVALLI